MKAVCLSLLLVWDTVNGDGLTSDAQYIVGTSVVVVFEVSFFALHTSIYCEMPYQST